MIESMKKTASVKKKICYILPEFREEIDSHFSYLYDFINVVSKDADIFLVVEKGNPPRDRFKSVSHLRKMHVHFLPLRIVEEFVILKWARLLGYKIFYTHYSYTGALLSALVTRILGGRAYYWNCGMPWLYGKQRALCIILKVVHVLVTGTVTMRELYAKEFNLTQKKIAVMPNWIDLQAFRRDGTKESIRRELDLPLDRKIVLFVHRLSERKGAGKIIQIASAVQEQSALFVVIGDGPLRKEIQDALEKNGLKKDILLLGKIPHRDVAAYFFASDIFIMPSEEEGFPHVLLEAMAAGLPFVATSVGGVRDIVPTMLQKYCVKSGNAIDFTACLKELLESSTLRLQVGMIEKSHVRKYDIHAVVEQFLIVVATHSYE